MNGGWWGWVPNFRHFQNGKMMIDQLIWQHWFAHDFSSHLFMICWLVDRIFDDPRWYSPGFIISWNHWNHHDSQLFFAQVNIVDSVSMKNDLSIKFFLLKVFSTQNEPATGSQWVPKRCYAVEVWVAELKPSRWGNVWKCVEATQKGRIPTLKIFLKYLLITRHGILGFHFIYSE